MQAGENVSTHSHTTRHCGAGRGDIASTGALVACADQKDVDYGEGAYQACLANQRNATPWLIENWDRLSPAARDLCVKANVPGGAMFYAVCIANVTKRETKDATVCRSLSAAIGFNPCR